jgi:phosphoenolpyruvate-protein kinase (PTS system EI component)
MLLIYLAMGYRNFSFRNAENADIGRRIASGVELTYLAALLENVMKLGSAEEVRSIVERFTREQIDHDRWNLKDMESILFDNEKP